MEISKAHVAHGTDQSRAIAAGWRKASRIEAEEVFGKPISGFGSYFVRPTNPEGEAFATPATGEEAWKELCEFTGLKGEPR